MKKIIKKIISGIAVLSMTAALLPQITFARTESGEYTVYENTFDNGAADLKRASADGYMAQNEFMYFDGILGEMPETATNNGNTGIRIGLGKWMNERTFLFDFTKGGTTGGVYAGIWTVSFDFAVDTAGKGDYVIVGINMSKAHEGGRMFYFYNGGTGGPCPSVGDWGANDTTKRTFENGVVHNLKTVINLEEGKAEYYLDDELWHTQTNLSNVIMKNYAISISDLWSYFDNLKITAQFPYTVENEIKTENTGNIFFEDEPVNLNLVSTNRLNETATENINMSITDIDGNVVWSDTQAVTMSALSTAQTQIIPPLDKFGVYNLKVTSDNAKEYTTRLSRSVRADKLNVKSGVAGHFDGRMSMDIPAMFDLMKSAGIGNLRTDWGCRTKDDGSVYDYANDGGYFKKTIEEANKHGIDILAILGTSVSGAAADGDFNTTGEALAAYKEYCKKLAQNLVGKVDKFELGNEDNYIKRRAAQTDITEGKTLVYSNGRTLLDTSKVYYNYQSDSRCTTANRSQTGYNINCTVTAAGELTVKKEDISSGSATTIIENVPAYVFCSGADYYKILQAGYEGIKAGNPNAYVATSGSSVVYEDPDVYTNRNQREFAQGLLGAAKTNNDYCFDAYAVHPYHIARAPEETDRWINYTKWHEQGTVLNNLFDSYNVPSDKMKWATEWGYTGSDSEQKTAWIIRTMLANEIYGCYDKMYLYDFINDGLDASNAEHNYGMICNPQNSTPFNTTAYAAKPQYLATAQFNKMLTGYSFESNEVSNDTVYTSKFTDNGDSVYVIWNTSATAADVAVSGVAKEMTVYDMYGNVIKTDKNIDNAEKSAVVSAGEEPIYVKFSNPLASLSIENNVVKAFVSNTGSEAKALPVVIVASYDGNDRLINMRVCNGFKTNGTEVTETAPGSYAVLSVDISDITDSVKVFMWDSLTDINPIVPVVSR